MVTRVIGSQRALRDSRRKWATKLRKINMSQLNRGLTFAEGGHGRVTLVQVDDHTDCAFALKTVKKSALTCDASRWDALCEKDVLLNVDSDFIVKLYKTFVDEKHAYFLTEYCPGGHLRNRVPLSEDAAKFYTACTVEALDCLRSRNIVHSDIKPANLVLDAEGYVRLIDMGLAREIQPGTESKIYGGTINYVPPEIGCWELGDRSRYSRDRGVDLWSLGVTVYKWLSGALPFQGANDKKTCLNIDRGIESVQFSEKHFSTDAVDLIKKLCAYDRKDRLGYGSVEEIRNHRWFQNFDWTALRNRELKAPVIPKVANAFDTQNFGAPRISSVYSSTDSSDTDSETEDYNWKLFDDLFTMATPF